MTRDFEVKKAEPTNTYVRLALVGPSGSGKTFSALRLATGMGGKIVVIDTENKRSEKYAKRFDFHRIDFQPPFNPASYGDAIDAALRAGAANIIVDSMSHEHEGEGGILEMAEAFLDKKAGDDWKKRENLKFASWIAPKRERNQLIVNKIQRTNANIILCFRAKEVTKPIKNPATGKIDPVKEWDMIGGDEYRYEMDVTAFLPSGAEGMPDWSNAMKRVNDTDGTLKKFLMEAGQINEDMGRKIKAMNTVTTQQQATQPAAKPETVSHQDARAGAGFATTGTAEETPEQKTKRLAGAIVTRINACKDAGELDAVMYEYVDDLEAIKAASVAAYGYVNTAKQNKIDSFGG